MVPRQISQLKSLPNINRFTVCITLCFVRLDALNMAWTGMSRGAVVYAVTCLPQSLTKLNLSGCRETLLDDGKSFYILLPYMVWVGNMVWARKFYCYSLSTS